MQMGRNYAHKYDLDPDLFGRAAALARAPSAFNSMPFLTDEEKQGLYLEATKKWHIPRKLIEVIAVGAIAAATQGMDESTISGATLFYPKAFGVTEMKNADLIEGLVNSAPYLCCSVIACWTSDYWNRHLGRKWTIFWTCLISAVTCIWQGFVNNWWHLFIARFFLDSELGSNPLLFLLMPLNVHQNTLEVPWSCCGNFSLWVSCLGLFQHWHSTMCPTRVLVRG